MQTLGPDPPHTEPFFHPKTNDALSCGRIGTMILAGFSRLLTLPLPSGTGSTGSYKSLVRLRAAPGRMTLGISGIPK